MKKSLVILLIFFSINVFGESNTEKFTGSWALNPFIIEHQEGILLSPSAEYALPYLGLTKLDFFSDSFAVLHASGESFHAFYDVEFLDFDNIKITFTLKQAEIFEISLAKKSKEEWLYLYRIPESSIFKPPALYSEKEDEKNVEEEDKRIDTEEAPPKLDELENENNKDSNIETTFSGVMKKIKE